MSTLGKVTRRSFLVGSIALTGGVAFGYWKYKEPYDNPLNANPANGEAALTPYILINQDGVTIVAPRAEMGQGVMTTLAAMVAEELECDVADCRVIHGPGGKAYYNAALLEEAVPFPPVTIITARALDHVSDLKTWCTGMISDQTAMSDGLQDDLTGDVEHALKVAEALGTHHHTVPINRRQFNELWPWMVKQTGLPLSTPNQVSIYQVAKSLSRHAKVALSGEGADEIFAGYDAQLMPFANYLQNAKRGEHEGQTPLDFYLQMTSWVPVQLKGDILNPMVMEQANQDYLLIEELQQIFGSRRGRAERRDGR